MNQAGMPQELSSPPEADTSPVPSKKIHWKHFDSWWRDLFESNNGHRATVIELRQWYDASACDAWPKAAERPTFELLKKHAKGVRTCARIQQYFRSYRKQNREARQQGRKSQHRRCAGSDKWDSSHSSADESDDLQQEGQQAQEDIMVPAQPTFNGQATEAMQLPYFPMPQGPGAVANSDTDPDWSEQPRKGFAARSVKCVPVPAAGSKRPASNGAAGGSGGMHASSMQMYGPHSESVPVGSFHVSQVGTNMLMSAGCMPPAAQGLGLLSRSQACTATPISGLGARSVPAGGSSMSGGGMAAQQLLDLFVRSQQTEAAGLFTASLKASANLAQPQASVAAQSGAGGGNVAPLATAIKQDDQRGLTQGLMASPRSPPSRAVTDSAAAADPGLEALTAGLPEPLAMDVGMDNCSMRALVASGPGASISGRPAMRISLPGLDDIPYCFSLSSAGKLLGADLGGLTPNRLDGWGTFRGDPLQTAGLDLLGLGTLNQDGMEDSDGALKSTRGKRTRPNAESMDAGAGDLGVPAEDFNALAERSAQDVGLIPPGGLMAEPPTAQHRSKRRAHTAGGALQHVPDMAAGSMGHMVPMLEVEPQAARAHLAASQHMMQQTWHGPPGFAAGFPMAGPQMAGRLKAPPHMHGAMGGAAWNAGLGYDGSMDPMAAQGMNATHRMHQAHAEQVLQRQLMISQAAQGGMSLGPMPSASQQSYLARRHTHAGSRCFAPSMGGGPAMAQQMGGGFMPEPSMDPYMMNGRFAMPYPPPRAWGSGYPMYAGPGYGACMQGYPMPPWGMRGGGMDVEGPAGAGMRMGSMPLPGNPGDFPQAHHRYACQGHAASAGTRMSANAQASMHGQQEDAYVMAAMASSQGCPAVGTRAHAEVQDQRGHSSGSETSESAVAAHGFSDSMQGTAQQPHMQVPSQLQHEPKQVATQSTDMLHVMDQQLFMGGMDGLVKLQVQPCRIDTSMETAMGGYGARMHQRNC